MQHDFYKDMMSSIRAELALYLNGEQSLGEFCDWFEPETWDIHLWAPSRVQKLVYGIKLILAEYDLGRWSETDLKMKFECFLSV